MGDPAGIGPEVIAKALADRALTRLCTPVVVGSRPVMERTIAWLLVYRRLAVRYERRADLHLALTTLACALVCFNQIRRFCPQL